MLNFGGVFLILENRKVLFQTNHDVSLGPGVLFQVRGQNLKNDTFQVNLTSRRKIHLILDASYQEKGWKISS